MLSSLVFSTTNQCSISCRYCGAECTPRGRAKLSLLDMINIIDQVYSFGKLELVVFTGGEPFLLGEDLHKCVEYCSKKKVLTRIVTNGYWAINPRVANEICKSYKKAGLTEFNISCDDYHQEFIPLERIKFFNDACIKNDIPALIGHKKMKGYLLTLDYLEKYLGYKLAHFNLKKKNPKNNVVSTGYTVPVEEEMHLIPDDKILYPPTNDHWKSPCSSVLQRIVITPYKELSICCGMIPRKVKEIVFGTLNKNSLEELIIMAHKDLIVNWLALEGPYGLMKFILKKDPSIQFRKKYVNNCHLCSEILTRNDCRVILLKYAHEKAIEISLERSTYDFIRNSENLDYLYKNPNK